MTLRLTIPGMHPPTCNQLMRGTRVTRIRMGKRWRDQIALAQLVFDLPRAQTKRRVTLHIGLDHGERGADVDAYWKATLDALAACGLIRDDTHRWVEITPVEYSRNGHKETIIDLEDVVTTEGITNPEQPR